MFPEEKHNWRTRKNDAVLLPLNISTQQLKSIKDFLSLHQLNKIAMNELD